MAYSVKADILEQLPEAELIQLTDDTGAGLVDDSVVDRAIADADALIDAHCQGGYSLPLTPVPAMIRAVSVDLAVYNLYSRRVDTAPETRTDRYKTARRFLERVAAGTIRLGAASPAPDGGDRLVEFENCDSRGF